MAKYVDTITLDFDGTIVHCSSIDPSDEIPVEPVKAMTADKRALGFTEGTPDFGFTCKVPMPPGGHEVDFFDWMISGREFSSTLNYLTGGYKTYNPCRIKSIKQPGEEGNKVETELEIIALDAYEG